MLILLSDYFSTCPQLPGDGLDTVTLLVQFLCFMKLELFLQTEISYHIPKFSPPGAESSVSRALTSMLLSSMGASASLDGLRKAWKHSFRTDLSAQ